MWKLFNILLLGTLCSDVYIHAFQMTPAHLKARQHAAMEARRSSTLSSRAVNTTTSARPKNITFTNPKASGMSTST